MSKTIEQIELELDSKIPRDVVSLRDGGGGRKLSYLEGWYVIDRLNRIFGPLGWAKEITDVRQVVNTTSKGEFPAYLVKVRLEVRVPFGIESPYNYLTVVKEGYGYGADKSGQNAHELAIKEAVTDALKVAAKDLGMSMGLALYDKTQENVEDEKQVETVRRSPTTSTPERAEKHEPQKDVVQAAAAPERGKIEETIRSYIRVAEKQKRLTVADFKTKLNKEHQVEKIAELSIIQLQAVLTQLQELTK